LESQFSAHHEGKSVVLPFLNVEGCGMPNTILNVTCNPPEPKAGQPFRLAIRLKDKANSDLQVSMEKQRIVANIGGFPELRPTGADYFDRDPKPIKVGIGSDSGTSDSIQVKAHPQGNPAVILPEQLLFSAFIGELSDGFRSLTVLILPATNF
jgi:hypothetical protein